jgi:hypothetical protein
MNMTTYVSLFEKSSNPKPKKKISIVDFLKGVKKGEWKEEQRAVQKAKGEKRDKIKKYQTPCVTLSGYYSKVRTGNPDTHSTFICIDIDGKDNEDLEKKRRLFIEDEYVYGCFRSISGNGFALLFKIKPSKHLESFNGIQKYLYDEYDVTVDPVCKDQSRLRFVSYDPDCFYDFTKKIWNRLIESKPTPKLNTSDHNEEDIKDLVKEIKRSGIDIVPNYHEWYIVGQALAILGENGRKYFHDISKISDAYSRSETDKQYDNCLKQEENGTRDNKVGLGSVFYYAKEYGIKFEGPKIVNKKKRLTDEHPQHVMLSVDGHKLHKGIWTYHIWGFKVTFKKDEKVLVECTGLNTEQVSDFLYTLGIRKNAKTYYRIVNRVVEVITWDSITDIIVQEGVKLPKDFVVTWDEEGDEIIRKAILDKVQEKGRFVIERNLMLKEFNPDNEVWLKDGAHVAYVPFKNGVLSITKDKVELLDHVKDYVWKNNIIDHEWTFTKKKSLIQDILENAVGDWEAVQTAIGYMCHNYIDKEGAKILFCIDKNVGEMNEGGNGKDFFRQILAEMRRTVVIPGKSLNMGHQFTFERIEKDTEIMWIEDLAKYIKMEQLYNMSDGIHVRKMHTNPYTVQCKVGISLQHLIEIEGSSDERRQIFLIFEDFYSKHGGIGKYHKVRNIFGEEWNDWDEYYNMMVKAIQLYFKKGVVKMDNAVLIEARNNELNSDGSFDQLERGVWYHTRKAVEVCWGISDPDISQILDFRKKLSFWVKNSGLEFHSAIKMIKGVSGKAIMIKAPMVISSRKLSSK